MLISVQLAWGNHYVANLTPEEIRAFTQVIQKLKYVKQLPYDQHEPVRVLAPAHQRKPDVDLRVHLGGEVQLNEEGRTPEEQKAWEDAQDADKQPKDPAEG